MMIEYPVIGPNWRPRFPRTRSALRYFLVGTFVCALEIWLIVYSSFSRDLRHVVIAVGTTTLELDIGLINLYATGRCDSFMEFRLTEVFTAICKEMAILFKRSTIAQLEAYACAAQSTFLQLIPTGCTSIRNLRMASFILALFLVLAIVCTVFSYCLFLAFWTFVQSARLRVGALAFSLLGAAFVPFGLVIYVALGGTYVDVSVPIAFTSFAEMDLSFGFLLMLVAAFWSMFMPAVLYFMMPEVECREYQTQQALSVMYAANELGNVEHYL